jgi:hypothetical protein
MLAGKAQCMGPLHWRVQQEEQQQQQQQKKKRKKP